MADLVVAATGAVAAQGLRGAAEAPPKGLEPVAAAAAAEAARATAANGSAARQRNAAAAPAPVAGSMKALSCRKNRRHDRRKTLAFMLFQGLLVAPRQGRLRWHISDCSCSISSHVLKFECGT